MSKEYNVFVFIPTYNCVDKVTQSIESIFNQTFDSKRLKIVAVDNCSSDGTYEKLIELMKKNKEQLSVYRLSQPTKLTRLWKKAAEILNYVPNLDYSTILLPGNVLYPECIERCTTLFRTMKYFEGSTLICEADLVDKYGDKYHQEPIYTDNCILKGTANKTQFLITGIGHRVQPFYRGFSISITTPLWSAIQTVDYNDWFNKFWGLNGDIIYIKDRLACLEEPRLDNPISDLMNRLALLKRSFYPVEANEGVVVGKEYLYKNMNLAYKGLAILALKYAIKEIRKEDIISANDCVLFAEMVYLDIIKEDMYISIKNSVEGKDNGECLYKYEQQDKSIEAPKECFVF